MSRREPLFDVVLGYQTLRVVRMPLDAMEDRVGAYHPNEGEIWLLAGLPALEELHTLLHELLHAVWRARTIDPEDDEERTVAALAEGLTELLVRNPELAARLGKAAGDA